VTIHDYADKDGAFGFNQVDHTATSTSRSCARPGCSRSAVRRRRDKSGQQIVLHDAVVQRRLRPARALSRLRDSEQPAGRAKVARTSTGSSDGAFYDAGKVGTSERSDRTA
jgi:hypothetical protein